MNYFCNLLNFSQFEILM